MPSVLGTAAEVILWPFGIRKKRRQDGEDRGPLPDEGGWEVDFVQFFGATAGMLMGWWAIAKLKALPSPAQTGSSTPSPFISGLHRLPLSDFFGLLRAGGIVAVTYMADRPPAGCLHVKTAAPLPLPLPSGSPELSVVPTTTTAETLLLPGCHERLFEELSKCKGLRYECRELSGDGDVDLSRLSLLIDLGGLAISVAAIVYLLSSTNSQGQSPGKHLEETAPANRDQRPAVTFDDVAGMEQTKEELREVISFLRQPGSYYALGARPPRGILLAGPSGTGKTLLARAVAGEAGVPFLYASSAAFVEVYVGQGAQRIRQFFEQARGCAPCIIFLDELDALGSARQASAPGGNQEYAQTLNQLLLELDGIESHTPAAGNGDSIEASQLVVTMAATNRYDCLDEALVRPGRIDRIVIVGLPNFTERVATLKIHSRKLCTNGLDFELLAHRTEGRSGADLAALLNDAALLAARRRCEAVQMEHVVAVLANPRPKQQRFQAAGSSDGQGDGWWTPEDGSRPAQVPPDFWARILAAAAGAMTSQGPTQETHDATVSGLD